MARRTSSAGLSPRAGKLSPKINATGSARVYSTYLGGGGTGGGLGIAVEGSGNAYVSGFTQSTNFSTINPLQVSYSGLQDAFFTKINATGSVRMYSTYLGGSGVRKGNGTAVDGSGNAYVTGQTGSNNFPSNAMQASYGGISDAFVLSISGNSAVAVFRDSSGAVERHRSCRPCWATPAGRSPAIRRRRRTNTEIRT